MKNVKKIALYKGKSLKGIVRYAKEKQEIGGGYDQEGYYLEGCRRF